MSTEKTEGVVIRQADFSESSRVVEFLTRDWGRVTVVAKGAKRLKSAFEVALDLLTVCNIVFIRKSSSGLDILTEAKLIKRFAAPGKALDRLYAGYYVAELLSGLTHDYEPLPQLYHETLATLRRLAGPFPPAVDPIPVSLIVSRFELILLQELGQLPQFEGCVLCGLPYNSAPWFGFRYAEGGLVCPECEVYPEDVRRVHPGTAAIILQLLQQTESHAAEPEDSSGDESPPHERLSWERLAVSPSQMRELRGILVSTISSVLGRRPKLLNYLKF